MKSLVNKWKEEYQDSDIYMFNYTRSICGILNKRAQDDEHLHYFHGDIYRKMNEVNDIVLGIDDSMKNGDKEKYSFIYKKFQDEYNNNEFSRHVNEAKRYIIFGCSLGDSDAWYFNKIFKQEESKIYEVYYHTEDEKIEMKRRIEKFSGISLADFQDKHHLIMISNQKIGRNFIAR